MKNFHEMIISYIINIMYFLSPLEPIVSKHYYYYECMILVLYVVYASVLHIAGILLGKI